jgi:endonuclease/exonuclease/phosphatase family metal-dependent hydrolase
MMVSWNLGNFGKSKTDEVIKKIAQVLKSKNADILAIQEVTAGKGFGAKKVSDLAMELTNSTGEGWDYVVSDPTLPTSPGVERYAYVFKKAKVSVNHDKVQLLSELQDQIDREPYYGTFSFKNKSSQSKLDVMMFSIHTVPTAKNPKLEVETLPSSATLQKIQKENLPAIFSGDFNLGPDATDPTFVTLGFKGTIKQKTSLKQKVTATGEYLFHQYDNVYVKNIRVCGSGVIDFVQMLYLPVTDESLVQARTVSDHLPVYVNFGP